MKPDVNPDKLRRGPRGLCLEAKCAFREGEAMLTVYGFWTTPPDALWTTPPDARWTALRCVLRREFVPSTTPKAERRDILRAMCDLIAIEHGESYYLRSKLQ